MTDTIRIIPGALSFAQLHSLATSAHKIVLDESCWPGVEAAADVVARAARGAAPVYGINTGFGKLATVRIAPDQIEELQRRLVLSHMCGLGPPLPDPVVRLVLALKAASVPRASVNGRAHHAMP
jgi:histidine ammonia-lyase